jgi:hypothetical protein
MDKIAEVIESSTRSVLAEVYREARAPAFGAWIEVQSPGDRILYGVVSHVEIGSFDPHRRAVAFGMTEEELRSEMPQVLELLRTTFRAHLLAYRDPDGSLRQTLPPHPASIHQFVSVCAPTVVRQLGRPFDYLRTLATHPDPAVPVDDLLVAVLGHLYRAHEDARAGETVLVEAGRALSRLMDDDHERLQAILRRVA